MLFASLKRCICRSTTSPWSSKHFSFCHLASTRGLFELAMADSTNRYIYFAGSIRAGRQDAGLYAKIVQILKKYGLVLTEHVGDPNLTEAGNNLT